MGDVYNSEIFGHVSEVFRKAEQDRREETPRTAEMREECLRRSLILEGYSRDAIDDMFAKAMGQILHEDIERALYGE